MELSDSGAVASARRPACFSGAMARGEVKRLPPWLAGAVVLAPHILVEDLSVASIAKAREAYRDTDLRDRLARYHDDPDSAFWGWNRIWLHPPFRQWSIEAEIGSIRAPLLAVSSAVMASE